MSDENKFYLILGIVLLFIGVIFFWRLEVVNRKEIEVSRDYWMNSTMWWINYSRGCK